nr:MAG TPA: hypothetical protein [Caudoviricetes sp.]
MMTSKGKAWLCLAPKVELQLCVIVLLCCG